LVISLDALDYGTIMDTQYINESTIKFYVQNEISNSYIIEQSKLRSNNGLITNKVDVYRKSILMLSYIDKQISDDTFERIINKNHYRYILIEDKWKLELFYVRKPTKFIKSIDCLSYMKN